jgi:hypothetical protein
VTKRGHYADYPRESNVTAEAALLTAWASLHRYHESLVLVGGLALKYLTVSASGLLPGPVTLDADFGVGIGTEGGQYGTIRDDLSAQGFALERGRFVRQTGSFPVYIDFLTEDPAARYDTVNVDDAPASVFPGIQRALDTKSPVSVVGADLYGVNVTADIPVCGIGPLIVLKLAAFGGGPKSRGHGKDAYDVLLAVTSYRDGFEAAIAAFRAEGSAANRAFPIAEEALRTCFVRSDQSAPARVAEFALGGLSYGSELEDRKRQILEQVVTVGGALLGE